MSLLPLNTSATTTNALLSMPDIATFSKKAVAERNYISFAFLPKKASRKMAAKLFSIDWDLNRNELEFE